MALRWRSALILLLGVVLCFAVYATGLAEKGEKDQKLTIGQLPAAVRATLESQAQGGTIQDIEKEVENGVESYSADILKDGQKLEVKIAADGSLIKSEPDSEKKGEGCKKHKGDKEENEVTVAFDQLPAPVQATLKAQVGSGTIEGVVKEDENGVVVFSADVLKDGQKWEVKIAADGGLIKSEIDADKEESGKDAPGDKEEGDENGETD